LKRVAIVSGGSRGFGPVLIRELLEDPDLSVATFSRSVTPQIQEMIDAAATSDRFYFELVDITDSEAVKGFVASVREHLGSVNILINNAGVALDRVLALQEEADIRQMLDVNLMGTVSLTKACVREMLTTRWGRIITITSIAGQSGYRGLSTYSMTKAGLDGFTRSLARELGDRGITVNSVAPGFMETAMTDGFSDEQRQQIIRRTPIGRLGTSGDVVPLVKFLCSGASGYITGQTIVVDGGITA
jgi:3-oxoacyl-[acyl-carrier protein] reductase